MNILFSFLGVVAELNRHLSARRVGRFGANLVLMVILGLVSVLGTAYTKFNSTPERFPTKMDVTQANTQARIGSFTLLNGVVYPGSRLSTKPASDREFVLVVAEKGDEVILANRGKISESPRIGWQAIRGTMVPMPSDLRDELQKKNFLLEGFKVNQNMILMAGAEPSAARFEMPFIQAASLGSLIVLLPLALTFGMGYRVFQPVTKSGVGGMAPAQVDIQGITLWATGRLAKDETHSMVVSNQRMTARVVPSGEIALIHEFAPGSIFGVLFGAGSVRVVSLGMQYGLNGAQPAAVVRFQNMISGAREELVLTFANETERAHFLGAISREANAQRAA